MLSSRAVAVQGLGFGRLLASVQGLLPIAQEVSPSGGFLGDFTGLARSRRRKLEEQLQNDPTPEVIAEAAKVFAADLPPDTSLQDAQREVARQIAALTRLSAILEALILEQVAAVIFRRQQEEAEAIAILLFGRKTPQAALAAIAVLEG